MMVVKNVLGCTAMVNFAWLFWESMHSARWCAWGKAAIRRQIKRKAA